MSQAPHLSHFGAGVARATQSARVLCDVQGSHFPIYHCDEPLDGGWTCRPTGGWSGPVSQASRRAIANPLQAGSRGGSTNAGTATLDTPLKKGLVGAGVLAILGSGLYIANKRGAIPGMGSMAEAERKNIPWWLVGGLTVLAAGDAVTPGFPFPGSAILMVPLAGAAWVAKASEYGVPAPGVATAAAPGSSNMGNKANEIFGEIYTALLHHPEAKKADFTALEQLKERYVAGDISLTEIEAVYQ